MATETIKTRAMSLQLENGTDAEGNMKYVSLSMGSLAKDRWDGDKAIAIVGALEPCLNKSVGNVLTTVVNTLSAS